MSFGIVYGANHPYYPTKITSDLSSQILSEIDPSIDQSRFNLPNLELNFDLENPLDTPCYIHTQEYIELEELYKKDQFEFINTILWEFLNTNATTQSLLKFLDDLIAAFPDQNVSSSEIDAYIRENTRYKSFTSYKTHIEKTHGIDFEEYKAYRQGKLHTYKQQEIQKNKPIHIPLIYTLPVLKKISMPMYIEIEAGMSENDIMHRLKNSCSLNQPTLLSMFPAKNRVRILYDALILYKYMKHTNFQFEKAVRYYNFHVLQIYGVSTVLSKHYISLKDRTKSNNLVGKIVTNYDFELTRNKATERKKVISAIEKAFELPKIGE